MRLQALGVLAVLLLPGIAAALPTPGLFCDTSDAIQGRIFPEAMETNDFVSYDEARCGIDLLLAEAPDRIRLDVIGESVGWDAVTGGHDTFELFAVRVSNYASGVADEDKVGLLFMLSIHGNEKGGREGGLRIIEDLAREIGYAQDHPEMLARLDTMELVFLFPNPDGWTHEELEYRHNDACYTSITDIAGIGACGEAGAETQSFVRVNGNGFDVNRQWPTAGWSQQDHEPMSQPEAIAAVTYLQSRTNLRLASDIHGMLQPADGSGEACAMRIASTVLQGGPDPTCFENAVAGSSGHFVLTMMPSGRQTTREIAQNVALAELIKERLNADPYFAEWNAVASSAGGVWGGDYNEWGTVWDTIGYTDSGIASDWFAQDAGLNVPGVDFEMAYNHITFDNYYPALAQRMNAYHVETVREIVRAFMDFAAEDMRVSIDTKGARTAFLASPTVVTNEGALRAVGWSAENPLDDAWDTGSRAFRASPNDHFVDLAADAAGTVERIDDLARLGSYQNLVIAGSASRAIADDADAKARILDWVAKGGNLVLTDEALQLLPAFQAAKEGSVDVEIGYSGATNFVDRDHALAQGIRGLARETYYPVPIGYTIDELSAPNWYVAADGFGGEVVGVVGLGQSAAPDPTKVNYGTVKIGEGRVSFLGSLLPDPVADESTFYALDSYALTYTGAQLLRNMLDWELATTSEPIDGASAGEVPGATLDKGVPGPTAVGLLGAVVALALVLRRRR